MPLPQLKVSQPQLYVFSIAYTLTPGVDLKLYYIDPIFLCAGSQLAAGYDLRSAYDYEIPAHGKLIVKTDLQICVPDGTYGRIAPRSGLAAKNFIDIGAGVVDQDYRY